MPPAAAFSSANAIARLEDQARLARAPRWTRLLRQPDRVIRSRWLHALARGRAKPVPVRASTFWGDEILVAIPEAVSTQILGNGFFEEGLTRALLALLRPGMTFVDIGAHFGYYTLLASRIVGPEGRVIAFEPVPETFGYLETNTRSCGNVKRIQAAAYSQAGELAFNDLGLEFSAFSSFTRPRLDSSRIGMRSIEVRAVTLDEELRDVPAAFVKIDAESAEWQVLQGMQRIIERSRPALAVEVGDLDIAGVPSSRSTIDHLLGLGYKVFECGSAQAPLVPHEPRERYGYDNLIFLP